MVSALEKYRNICREANKSFGMHIVRPNEENIKSATQQGYTMLALGLDNVFLDEMS